MTQPPKPIISFVHPQAANLQKAFSAGNLLDDVDKSEEEVSDSELDDLFGSKPKQRKKRGPPARKELKSSKKIKLDDNVKSDELGTSDTLNYRKDEKANPLKKSGDKKQGINIKPAKKAEELLIISDSDSEDGVPDVNQILDENSNSKSTEQPAVRNKIKVKPVYVDENTLRQDPSIASSFNALNALRALKSRSQQLATSTPELDTNFDMTSNYSRGNDANPRDILLLIKSTIPDTETRGLLKVRYLRDDNFRKLMEVLSKVFSIDQYMIVVKFDGIALNINDTPRKYGMEDNDVLVASLMDQKPVKTSRELTKSKGLTSSSKTVMPSLEFKESFDEFDEDAFDLNGSIDESKMKAVEEQIEKEIEAKFNATKQDDEVSAHEDKIMLKVVLPAGRDPMQFRLAKDAPLSKIIAAVSKSLNVPENKVKLSFDGQVLNPMTTPLDHDMEDEDMLDAVIKKN